VKQEILWGLVVLLLITVPVAYLAFHMQSEGRAKCTAVGGVWLGRELKCIVGTNLREVKI